MLEGSEPALTESDPALSSAVDFEGINKWISGEWAVIAHAPVSFATAIVVMSLLIWRVVQWQSGTQLSNATSTLALRDAQLQDYKDKLSGATPDAAKARMDALEARIEEMVPQIAALAPRQLAAEQISAMRPILDQFRGTAIDIASDAAVPDIRKLAAGFAAVFSSSGWIVRTPLVMGVANPPPSGIGLRMVGNGQLTPAHHALAAALTAAGVKFDHQPGDLPHHMQENQPAPIATLLLTQGHPLHD